MQFVRAYFDEKSLSKLKGWSTPNPQNGPCIELPSTFDALGPLLILILNENCNYHCLAGIHRDSVCHQAYPTNRSPRYLKWMIGYSTYCQFHVTCGISLLDIVTVQLQITNLHQIMFISLRSHPFHEIFYLSPQCIDYILRQL